MPKKILFESTVHQFLCAGKRMQKKIGSKNHVEIFSKWLNQLRFEYPSQGLVVAKWDSPKKGSKSIDIKPATFYRRGDTLHHKENQEAMGLVFSDDHILDANADFFDKELMEALKEASLFENRTPEYLLDGEDQEISRTTVRKNMEAAFHDDWAESEDVTKINIRTRNEACTAPEMRHIRKRLGNLNGKTLLDIGCGLGEASVYFAMEGAIVTATDISSGMCSTLKELATINGVSIETHVSAIEDLGLGNRKFDIIYTGNTLHHADITATMNNVIPHLKDDGVFVSWDPVAYNPIINLYRLIATKVRTEDEHPLKLKDIKNIRSRFYESEVHWFWLTTQLIFILMVLVQFRSPNKERFWKKIIDEADSWAWIYKPLFVIDKAILKLFPILRPLCWNVVIVAKNPNNKD